MLHYQRVNIHKSPYFRYIFHKLPRRKSFPLNLSVQPMICRWIFPANDSPNSLAEWQVLSDTESSCEEKQMDEPPYLLCMYLDIYIYIYIYVYIRYKINLYHIFGYGSLQKYIKIPWYPCPHPQDLAGRGYRFRDRSSGANVVGGWWHWLSNCRSHMIPNAWNVWIIVGNVGNLGICRGNHPVKTSLDLGIVGQFIVGISSWWQARGLVGLLLGDRTGNSPSVNHVNHGTEW